MPLIPGNYKVKEIESPNKYLLDDKEYDAVVTQTDSTLMSIKNEPEKVNIKVKKEWVGTVGNPVKAVVKLGDKVIASQELKAPNWEYTFEVRKYDAKTNEPITNYTVDEETVQDGYKKEIKGNMNDGFTIINKKDVKPNGGGNSGNNNQNGGSTDNNQSNKPPINNERIHGSDRLITAIKISQKYYNKAKTVIVVRNDLFPDSMTASVLAKLKDAPILLNWAKSLDPRVDEEIKRLGATEVIIVGGPDSVSENVRNQLKIYDEDREVERIAGSDRYGTSEMVAKRVTGITGKKNTGVVASGQVFPDALAVGTFASRDSYPILLVKKDSIPDRIKVVIKDLDITKTYIAGGLNTINKSVESQLPKVLERMAGKNRYETSVAIANSKFKESKDTFIASGIEFADALVISPISGKYNKPTLLVSTNKKSNIVVKKYIKDKMLESITTIGGEKYIPMDVLKDLVTR